jgi:hypothetical protein
MKDLEGIFKFMRRGGEEVMIKTHNESVGG